MSMDAENRNDGVPGVPDEPQGAAGDGAGAGALGEQGAASPEEERRPSRKAAWLAVVAVAVALGVIWVAPGINDPQQATTEPGLIVLDGPGDPGDANAEGKPASLQFTLKDMNGIDVHLASFKGKIILMNFWATWCGPCRDEIPSLVKIQEKYGDRLVILGISVDDPIEKLKPYAERMHMNYPVLVGKGREDFQEAYGPLYGIPVSVFIDRNGTIAKRHSGIASQAQFERQIEAMLAESQST